MIVTYEEATRAQKEIEDGLLEDPNIVSVGVVEEIDKLGKKTGNYVIQVGIVSSEIYQHSLNKIEKSIPEEYELLPKIKGQEKKHIRINVVEEGQIQALNSNIEKTDFPSAEDKLSENITEHKAIGYRVRPSLCGSSIGHPTITAGTMGLLLEYVDGPDKGNAYILSNNHVLAANNSGHVGDAIIQPGSFDAGQVGKDTIGHLHRWVPLAIRGKINYVDAAVAEVCEKYQWSKSASPCISNIGMPNNFAKAEMDIDVEKTGRTTGYTQGRIVSINESIKVKYTTLGLLIFKNQIRTTQMSRPGDSGACLVKRDSKEPVGLLFAGSNTASYFNDINMAVSSLSNKHVNVNPATGNSIIFDKVPNFKMIRREYSTSNFSDKRTLFQELGTIGFSSSSANKRSLLFFGIGCFLAKGLSEFTKSEALVPTLTSTKPVQVLTFLFGDKHRTLSHHLDSGVKKSFKVK